VVLVAVKNTSSLGSLTISADDLFLLEGGGGEEGALQWKPAINKKTKADGKKLKKKKNNKKTAKKARTHTHTHTCACKSQCIMELKDGLVFISYVMSYEPLDI